jgi:NAD(P)H dehydrogenase (quinone)
MNVLIVIAHPEPKSFNYAMFKTAVETFESGGHKVKTTDLYVMKFNPVSDRSNYKTVKDPEYFKQQIEEMHAVEKEGFNEILKAEMEKVREADFILFQFPLWWFSVPAVLKGWFDKVFAMNFAYGGGKIYDTGYFKGKKAMLSVTTGGPEILYTKDGLNGEMNMLLYPINHGILYFTGITPLEPHIVYSPVRLSDEERKKELEIFKAKLTDIEKITSLKF